MSADSPLLYWLHLDGGTLPVRTIEGFEAISKPFRVDVRLTREGGLPDEPEALLKLGASVLLERGGHHVRRVAGVVTEVSASAAIRGVTEIHVVIEPQLALLRHRVDYRIFRDKSVPEIVTEVLGLVGIRPGASGPSGLSLRLSGSYAKRPYCVQCRESDLDFVHRLLEDEGIFYYFLEQGGLVLGDHTQAYESIAAPARLPFRGGRGLEAHDDDAVTAIARRASVSVGKVSLKDFDLEKPSLDLSASAEGPTPGGPEHYDYPGEYTDPGEGARKAKLRAESFACASAGFSGETLCGRLAPGHVFTLEGAPGGVGEGRHVVTRVAHAWDRASESFSCAFDSLAANTAFRPMRVTPSPQLVNPVTGIVTGPSGKDVHTDALGRVKVHFHWDRLQPHDDACSDWIPVLQDNTGHSVGIPRVGWEVLVHFLEGDPDRPVVLGRVYNAEDNFPNELPAGKTKSAIKSMSSPGRNGTNQIELDDIAGQEKVTVIAERDQNIKVANDKAAKVDNDDAIVIVRDERIAIEHDQIETVGGNFSHVVEGNQTRKVGGSRTRKVSAVEKSTVVQNRRLTIGGMHQRKVGTDDVVQAKNLTERVGAVNLEAFVKTNTTSSGMTSLLTVGGALIEVAKDQKTESASMARVETIGGLVFTKAGRGISSKAGKTRIVTVGGSMIAKATGAMVLTAGKKLSMKVGTGGFKAKTVLFKVGDSFLLLKDGVAVIHAGKTLKLDIADKNALDAPGIAIIPASVGELKADAGKQSGKAGDTSGSGTTGSGFVAANGDMDKGTPVEGVGPKGPPSPLEALKSAVQDGLGIDPKHAGAALVETLRSYASKLGIRQGTDGQAIPLSGSPAHMVKTLDTRADTYAAARERGDGSADALRDGGLAWEKVSANDGAALASRGDLVVKGYTDPAGRGYVGAVMPPDLGDGVVDRAVVGDGVVDRVASGDGLVDRLASDGVVERVAPGDGVVDRVASAERHYRFVPPDVPEPALTSLPSTGWLRG